MTLKVEHITDGAEPQVVLGLYGIKPGQHMAVSIPASEFDADVQAGDEFRLMKIKKRASKSKKKAKI